MLTTHTGQRHMVQQLSYAIIGFGFGEQSDQLTSKSVTHALSHS